MNPQDPLASLHPLRAPELISWWPLAPGWWLLLALVFACAGGLAYLAVRRHKQNRYRRLGAAQQENLYGIYQQSGDTRQFVCATNALLKSVALQAFPASDIAATHSDAWVSFLNRGVDAANAFETSFTEAVYAQQFTSPDPAQLQKSALHWIRHHPAAA